MDYRMLSAFVVFLFPAVSVAQPVGTDKCQCVCLSGQNEDGNGGRMSFVIHESADFTICPIFNDRSCEIEDPDTGERWRGVTDMCEPLSDERHEELKSSGGK